VVKNNDLPKASPFDLRVAAEFGALRRLLEQDLDRRVTQQQVAARLNRSQAYVSEQWRGVRPLGIDVIQATAAEANQDAETLLLALAMLVDPSSDLDVSGMSDAEVLDALTTRQVSSRAYGLAARRRAERGNTNDVNGFSDGGS